MASRYEMLITGGASIGPVMRDGRLTQMHIGACGWHFDPPAVAVGDADLRSSGAIERLRQATDASSGRAAGSEPIERRLSAVLMADVAGYSRLIGTDDEGTVAKLNAHHAVRIEPKITKYRGRIVRTTGDGLLVLFESVVAALRCSVEIQRAMADWNVGVPCAKRIEFRMGIAVGDIIDGPGVHGDAVNVAARLEALADVGGICVTERVLEDAQGSIDTLGATFEDAGRQQLKNIARPVRVYRVRLDGIAKVVRVSPLCSGFSIANRPTRPALDRVIQRLLSYLRCGRPAGAPAIPQSCDLHHFRSESARHISRVRSPRAQLERVP